MAAQKGIFAGLKLRQKNCHKNSIIHWVLAIFWVYLSRVGAFPTTPKH